MRRLILAVVTALVAANASPPPAFADTKSDAVVAGALIGALIAGAAANRNRNANHRFNYATDQIFFPPRLPGVMCYARARQCYERGHYSVWATREVFQ